MGWCFEIENTTMVGYDSRPAVTELLCNRPLANVLHCGYISRLKWNLDPADPTENVSPEDRSDWGKEIHHFCECENGMCIFLWFYHFLFLFFILFYVY